MNFGTLLGTGWYSEVYNYPKEEKGEQDCAIKIYTEMEDHESGKDVWNLFENEVKALTQLAGQSLVPRIYKSGLLNRGSNSEKAYLVMEKMHFLGERNNLTTSDIKRLVNFMKYCYIKYKLCHGDIKFENVMRNRKGELCLIDWNYANFHPSEEDLKKDIQRLWKLKRSN